MTAEFVLQLIAIAGVGIGVYAGIRADIAGLHVKVEQALKAAERAHARIDDHFDERRPR